MHAMECTRTEMDDTDVNAPPVVAGPYHFTIDATQVGLRQELRHYRTTPVFQMEISRSSLSSLRAGLPEVASMMSCMSLCAASSMLRRRRRGRYDEGRR